MCACVHVRPCVCKGRAGGRGHKGSGLSRLAGGSQEGFTAAGHPCGPGASGLCWGWRPGSGGRGLLSPGPPGPEETPSADGLFGPEASLSSGLPGSLARRRPRVSSHPPLTLGWSLGKGQTGLTRAAPAEMANGTWFLGKPLRDREGLTEHGGSRKAQAGSCPEVDPVTHPTAALWGALGPPPIPSAPAWSFRQHCPPPAPFT